MNQQKAAQDYALRGAEQLKKDGNKLVGEGKYTEAIEKYMRVKNNLKDDTSPNARALRTSCMLNMSLCFNKTDRFNSAISECTEVLRSDGRSLKAYYRRGQAYSHKKAFREAVADLRRAVKLSPGDETVAAELETSAVADLTASGEEDDGVTPEFEVSAGASSATNAGGFGPDMMAKAAEAMKDPDFMSKASDMMENMTDEQLEAMSAMGRRDAEGGPQDGQAGGADDEKHEAGGDGGHDEDGAEMKDAGMDPTGVARARPPSADHVQDGREDEGPGDAGGDERHDEEHLPGAAQGEKESLHWHDTTGPSRGTCRSPRKQRDPVPGTDPSRRWRFAEKEGLALHPCPAARHTRQRRGPTATSRASPSPSNV